MGSDDAATSANGSPQKKATRKARKVKQKGVHDMLDVRRRELNSRMKYITRLDQWEERLVKVPGKRFPVLQPRPKSVGYWVRILNGPIRISKFFSDSKHGGRYSALAKAMAFRDKMEVKHNLPSTSEAFHINTKTNTGFSRIRKVMASKGGSETLYPAFRIVVPPVLNTSVHIGSDPEDVALLKALEIRDQAEIEKFGAVIPRPREKDVRKQLEKKVKTYLRKIEKAKAAA